MAANKLNHLAIDRMLNLSTAHIKESTRDYLDADDRKCLVVYDKPTYGWFIYIVEETFEQVLTEVPEDLAQVLRFTKEQGCRVLCMDMDEDTIEELPSYDW